MFGKKIIVRGVEEKEEPVSCSECWCLIKKVDAYFVENRNEWGKFQIPYCHKCKPKYSRVVTGYGHRKYYAEVEVDEKGKPIK